MGGGQDRGGRGNRGRERITVGLWDQGGPGASVPQLPDGSRLRRVASGVSRIQSAKCERSRSTRCSDELADFGANVSSLGSRMGS